MENSTELPTTKTSKINAAVDQIYRFGDIWRNAYRHRLAKDYHSWNLDLDTAFSELAGDLKQKYANEKTEKDDKGNKFSKLDAVYAEIHKYNTQIVKLEPLISGSIQKGFNKVSKEDIQKVSLQYIWLNKKEVFIRELQNEMGKGTLWDSGDEDDID